MYIGYKLWFIISSELKTYLSRTHRWRRRRWRWRLYTTMIITSNTRVSFSPRQPSTTPIRRRPTTPTPPLPTVGPPSTTPSRWRTALAFTAKTTTVGPLAERAGQTTIDTHDRVALCSGDDRVMRGAGEKKWEEEEKK